MPTYEYECQKCGDHFEIEQKITAGKLTKCSKCKGKLERIIAATGFSLKGGGWYKDGYNKKGNAKADTAVPPPASSTTSKSDA